MNRSVVLPQTRASGNDLTGVLVDLTKVGGRMAVAVLWIGAFAVVVLAVVIGFRREEAQEDALQVYCLAPEQQVHLVNAAEALNLAGRGSEADLLLVDGMQVTSSQWRDQDKDRFLQACAALSSAQRPPATGLLTTLLPFLTGLTGALIAFGAASWRDRVARGRALADDLRLAGEAFRRAAETYLADWRPSSSDAEVIERRAALHTQLSRAKCAHRGWSTINRVAHTLAGKLGPTISTGWRTGPDWEERDDTRRDELRVLLGTLQEDVSDIADALEQPLRSRSGMPLRAGGGAP